jgi:hypothetical protein
MEEFRSNVKLELQNLGFVDEEVHQYILGILSDSTSSAEEKTEGITEFLSAGTVPNFIGIVNP